MDDGDENDVDVDDDNEDGVSIRVNTKYHIVDRIEGDKTSQIASSQWTCQTHLETTYFAGAES